jgi:hypothetical protein
MVGVDDLQVRHTDRFVPFNAPFDARLGFQLLEGDAIPQHLRNNLARQVANGLDPLRRVGDDAAVLTNTSWCGALLQR